MTVPAPAAIAFAMSPDEVRPPSAITGTSCCAATCAHSWMAVTCGTPTPATTRVVQIEPGPTPTFSASAPRSISASAASAVAMLPTTSSTSKRSFSVRVMAMTFSEWPWAVSRTSTSTPASTSAAARSSASGPTPTAAPTHRRPRESLVALGYSIFLAMSFTVISPRRTPSASTTGSFSILLRCRISSASSSVVPTGAVTRLRAVMSSETGARGSFWKRRSRFVRMPTRRPLSSVIGTPEMR